MPAGGYKLPKGQDVMISIYNLHHSPAGGPRSSTPCALAAACWGCHELKNPARASASPAWAKASRRALRCNGAGR